MAAGASCLDDSGGRINLVMTFEEKLKKAKEQAEIIKMVVTFVETLDIDFLEQSHKEMSDNLSTQEAAIILSPNPHTIMQQLEVKRAKLAHLRCMLDLAKSRENIQLAKKELLTAEKNSAQLKDFFL